MRTLLWRCMRWSSVGCQRYVHVRMLRHCGNIVTTWARYCVPYIYLMNRYTAQYSGIPALLSPCGYGYCAGHSSRTLLCDCTSINLNQTKSGDVATTLETYICMTQRLFTHATPTRFNAGRRLPHKFFTCITNRPGCYHKWHLRCVEAVLYII